MAEPPSRAGDSKKKRLHQPSDDTSKDTSKPTAPSIEVSIPGRTRVYAESHDIEPDTFFDTIRYYASHGAGFTFQRAAADIETVLLFVEIDRSKMNPPAGRCTCKK